MTVRNSLDLHVFPEDSVVVPIDHQPNQPAKLNRSKPQKVVNNMHALTKVFSQFEKSCKLAIGLLGISIVYELPARADTVSDTSQQVATQRYFAPDSLPAPLDDFRPVTDEMLINPPEGSWLTYRADYGLSGYVELDQINRDTVGQLQLAWSWALNGRRTEVQPLVHDGIMYLNQSGDTIQALDAATGDLFWSYERELPDDLFVLSYANRNIAIYENKILVGTSDAHLLALDALSGDILWEVEVADHEKGYAYTAGPIVADGLVIAPMSGCALYNPGGCWVSAHDPETGEEVWRFYTNARPGEPGGDTWGDVPVDSRHGGSVWMPPAYDAQTKTLYVGTAVPVPWGRAQRDSSGEDKLHTNSTVALDVATGTIKWAVQHIPADNFDMDTAFERHLLTTPVTPGSDIRWKSEDLPEGEADVIFGMFGKSGIIRTMDRETGRLLWARETYSQNVVDDIDMETGKARLNEDIILPVGETAHVCPSLYGGRNWPGASVDPERNLFFIAYNNTCMDYTLKEVNIETGAYHGSADYSFTHAPDRGPEGKQEIGTLLAVDIATGETRWRHDQRSPLYGSLLATGGGLVFGGGVDRVFNAHDSETGAVLWTTRLPTSAQGYPVSYSVDGVQYIAVPAGYGLAFSDLTPELPQPNNGASLMVFRLPDETLGAD